MKKVLIVLLLIGLVCTSIFASGKLTVGIVPYAIDIDVDNNDNSVQKSKYGYGGSVDYRYYFDDKLYAIGGEADIRLISNGSKKTTKEVAALFNATLCYTIKNQDVIIFGTGKFGVTYFTNESSQFIAPTIGAEVGFGYEVSEGFRLDASVDGQYSIIKNSSSNLSAYSISPKLGLVFDI